MRLLRILGHLVLVIAVLAVAGAQARPVCSVSAVPPPHGHHTSVEQAVHDHGDPPKSHAAHKGDLCQTICCVTPMESGTRATVARPVVFSSVQYEVAEPCAADRTVAPDPGVPKHLS